ncbi:MAG TPA: ABC transporter substrate-binding protein [Alphaproteobacteria bacterium]|nr:ABC transporter substrate-binding protein [Alphaproteobacteria bacterium]
MNIRHVLCGLLAATALACGSPAGAAEPVHLSFWYPVDLGGGLAKVIDGLVADFDKAHPDIQVTPTYTGSYDTTLQKIQAAKMAGTLPDVAVTEISSVPVLGALGAARPLDALIAGEGGKKFLDKFWPSMLLNCVYDGKVYGIPFQRSTPVMYYNKDAFKAAGLDPDKPPLTWDELVADAEKLTKRDGDRVTQWGLELPLEAFNWFYYALVYSNGGQSLSPDGTKALWDQPPELAALGFWHDLVNKYKVTPAYTPWNDGPQEFAAGKVAMIWHSTGSQAFMRQNVKFAWGLGRIPKHAQFGPPSGGGNLMLYATDPARQKAAWSFIVWLSDAKQAARWSIASGYLATNVASWDLPEMKALVKEHPEVLVTKAQLADAKAEPASAKYAPARDILNALIKDVLANKAQLEPAVKEAVANANAAMAKQ